MYDVVVIGAGPSGLATGCALKHYTNLSFILIDSGKDLFSRSRYDAEDLVHGLGGAGLFSDGKFSFYPSSSVLWTLNNKENLVKGYDWYRDSLMKHSTEKETTDTGTKVPKYPEIKESDHRTDEWFLKEYESIYLPLDARYAFIDDIRREIGLDKFMLGTTVTTFKKVDDRNGYHYEVCTQDTQTNKQRVICCKNIVIAGGRFWPHSFTIDARMKFSRLEYGVRVQTDPEKSLFSGTTIKDPKYKYVINDTVKGNSPLVEYRTFCCCRNGEIVVTRSNGISTCSGRSDCEPTKLSNIGFNVRILNKSISDQISEHLFDRKDIFENIPIIDAIKHDALIKHYGDRGNDYLVTGLKLLLERFPDFKDAKLYGPTIEGVGQYPETDNDMRIPDENIWVIGDAGGKFRGITACMVSGYYVGLMIQKLYGYETEQCTERYSERDSD